MHKSPLDKSDLQMPSAALRPTRQAERAVHVLVPDEAYHHAKLAAVASRLPFKVFMARLMLAASAITADGAPTIGPHSTNMAVAGQPTAAGDG